MTKRRPAQSAHPTVGDELHQLRAMLRETETVAAGIRAALAARDARVSELQDEISLLRAALAAGDERLRRTNEELCRLEADLFTHRQVIANVYASYSWRLTSRLRQVGDWVSRLLPAARQLLPAALRAAPTSRSLHQLELFRLERDPLSGVVVLHVGGWCFELGNPEPARLQLCADEEVLEEIDCDIVRRDVADTYPDLVATSSLPVCGFKHVAYAEPARTYRIAAPDGSVVARAFADGIPAPIGLHQNPPADVPPAPTGPEVYWKNNEIKPHLCDLLATAQARFAYRPTISIVMPVYNAEAGWLRQAIESVQGQIYPNWELCVADDASTSPETRAVLGALEGEPRVKIAYRRENGGICAASNDAAAQATGELLAFMDQDDRLAPQALFEIVRLLQVRHDADVIYSDEDKIDPKGRHCDLHFKPDWSPVLFLGYNYINHLTCIRRGLFEAVGRFRPGYEGAQDYDLLLRVIERTEKIHHIPKVLYHWRAAPGSVASAPHAKPIVKDSVDRALAAHIERSSIPATVYQPELARIHHLPINQLDWPDRGPSVEIVIPTRNHHGILKSCIDALVTKTTYRDYTIMVVDDDSDGSDMLAYLSELSRRGIRVERVASDGEGFSLARVNNEAARLSAAEYVLFLNDDTEIREPRWLSRMMGYVQLPGVGAAGARLLCPDGSTQHGGIVLHMEGGVAPRKAFRRHPPDRMSYFFLAETARECAALSAACMLTARVLFLELRGFDERRYPVSLNDVDYCLRLQDRGFRCIYVAGAEAIRHGSESRGREDDPAELAHFRTAYRTRVDPYYNPNLSNRLSFAPGRDCTLDYDTYRDRPLKVLFFTHSLELKGAPKRVADLAAGLATRGGVNPMVAAFAPGSLQTRLDAAGVPVETVHPESTGNALTGWKTAGDYSRAVDSLVAFLQQRQPDVVVGSGVNCFFVMDAAASLGIPALWMVHENYDAEMLSRVIQPFTLPNCEAAFAKVHRVVFDSRGTCQRYRRYDSRDNFTVIHTALSTKEIDTARTIPREVARAALGLEPKTRTVVSVGTVCARKDQETLLRALAVLSNGRSDFRAYIVGLREGDAYCRYVGRLAGKLGLQERVHLVTETPEVHRYYRAADVFACTSRLESYPTTILEAMAHGLPIVTTPCGGVTEQVRFGVNALQVPFGDHAQLAERLELLLSDDETREPMATCSRRMFECLPTHADMLDRWHRLLAAAWQVDRASPGGCIRPGEQG